MRCLAITVCTVLGFSAAAEAACPAPYTAEQLGSDLSALSSALRGQNPDAFEVAGKKLTTSLECVDAPLAPVVLASVYRYAGLYHHSLGDKEAAQGWFRTALELDSSYDWGVSEVGVEDPVRLVFDSQRTEADRLPEPIKNGKILDVPDGMRVLSDGRVLREASLTPDRPHLIQLVAISGNRIEGVWLVNGAELPDRILQAPAVVEATTAPSSGGKIDVERIERTRPPMKTPVLIGGGLLMAGGAGLYAMSFGAHKEWEAATTVNDLNETRTITNALVLAAGASLTLGAGLTWAGIALDGGPTLHWRGSF